MGGPTERGTHAGAVLTRPFHRRTPLDRVALGLTGMYIMKSIGTFGFERSGNKIPLPLGACLLPQRTARPLIRARRSGPGEMADNEGASTEDIFEKVALFFFENEDFANSFEAWANEHCDIFTEDEEQKLEYTTLYNTFTEMFETRISSFLESCSWTLEKFQEECKKAAETENDNWGFLQMMMAVTDYDMFVGMMKEQSMKKKMGHEMP